MALGGLGLFLLGIQKISDALQEFAGPAARRFMASATSSPFRALLTGAGVAAATQSANATAITALGLVAGGFVGVSAGIALLLGAKAGATLAMQLAAFRLGDHALTMIGIGFFAALLPRLRAPGTLLLGAGLLFLGLETTVNSMTALSDSEVFSLLIVAAENQHLIVLLLGALLGGVLSSSNAVTAVALGLELAGAVTLPTALVLIAGGTAGSTVMPLLVARTLDANAQRAALMQTIAFSVMALLLVPFLGPAVSGLEAIGGGEARMVANGQTLFATLSAVVGTLLAPLLGRLGERLVPVVEDDAAPKYLRPEAVSEPTLASALALRETVRVSDQVAVMMGLAVESLRSGRWNREPIRAREAKVDSLTHDIIDYLAHTRRLHGNDPATERLLLIVTELEHMGDQIRRMGRREEKLRTEGLEFSQQGRAELAETSEQILSRMRKVFTALATGDKQMARGILDGREEFEALISRMRVAHMSRLEEQLPESRASSSHHLEVLTLLRDIDGSVKRLAYQVILMEGGGQAEG